MKGRVLLYIGCIAFECKSGCSPTLTLLLGDSPADNCQEGDDLAKKDVYVSRTESYLEPITKRMGFELVDVEFVKEGADYYLRAYIDKEGGITINDCEAVSREMNEILDREDYISEAYVFEVSSPGLFRPLKKEKDYVRNMGKLIEIRTYQAIDKQKEFHGILTDYDAETVTIQTDDEQTMKFARSEISLIRQWCSFD
jgi:ribosome maturation factor RimP